MGRKKADKAMSQTTMIKQAKGIWGGGRKEVPRKSIKRQRKAPSEVIQKGNATHIGG